MRYMCLFTHVYSLEAYALPSIQFLSSKINLSTGNLAASGFSKVPGMSSIYCSLIILFFAPPKTPGLQASNSPFLSKVDVCYLDKFSMFCFWHILKIQSQKEPKIQPTRPNQCNPSGNQEIVLICGLYFHPATFPLHLTFI